MKKPFSIGCEASEGCFHDLIIFFEDFMLPRTLFWIKGGLGFSLKQVGRGRIIMLTLGIILFV
jgi:hypothetical protein